MTHKERNHIYFEEQCWFLTMSRASSFLRLFPSLLLRVPRWPQGSAWGGSVCPGPCPDPLVQLPPFSSSEQSGASRQSRACLCPSGRPGRVRVSARGAMSRDVHGGTRFARSVTPQGPLTPQAMAAPTRWEPDGAPNPRVGLGEGSGELAWCGTQDTAPAVQPWSPLSPCPASPSSICC